MNGTFPLLAKIAKARAPLFVALALPHGQQAVDHTAENLRNVVDAVDSMHTIWGGNLISRIDCDPDTVIRIKDKQTINHEKPVVKFRQDMDLPQF